AMGVLLMSPIHLTHKIQGTIDVLGEPGIYIVQRRTLRIVWGLGTQEVSDRMVS
ncbi:hypothetical protein J6590_102521, partial [Homalodisca vitripennis]